MKQDRRCNFLDYYDRITELKAIATFTKHRHSNTLVDIGPKWPRLEVDYIRSFIAYCYYPLVEASHKLIFNRSTPLWVPNKKIKNNV